MHLNPNMLNLFLFIIFNFFKSYSYVHAMFGSFLFLSLENFLKIRGNRLGLEKWILPTVKTVLNVTQTQKSSLILKTPFKKVSQTILMQSYPG
jgi:hypothetical protein